MGNVAYVFAKSKDLSKKLQMIDAKLAASRNSSIDIEQLFSLTDALTDICSNSYGNQSLSEEESSYIFNQSKRLFYDIERLEEKRFFEDFKFLKRINAISLNVDEIEVQFVYLSPQEILEKIDQLYDSLEELSKEKSYNISLVNQEIAHCLKKIQSLHFRLIFPITEELRSFSYQNTFAHRLFKWISVLENNEKEFFFNTLVDEQKEYVSSHANKDFLELSNKQKAKIIKQYFNTLKSIETNAREFFFGSGKEAVKQFKKLPEIYKNKIDQILWSLSGEILEQLQKRICKEEKKAKHFMTIAMMKFLSEHIN